MHGYRFILRAKRREEYIRMSEILIILVGVVLGVLPTLYVIWEAIATISMKVVRKIKYGTSLFE